MRPDIHPTAIVHAQAKLADDVVIGPYTILGPEVSLGRGTQVSSHCVLEYVSMGCDNFIAPGVYIGQAPQHSEQFEHTHAIIIGDNNRFREGFTIHRGIDRPTRIGSHGLFMAQSHVAHDCRVADSVIMANGALLGGIRKLASEPLFPVIQEPTSFAVWVHWHFWAVSPRQLWISCLSAWQ